MKMYLKERLTITYILAILFGTFLPVFSFAIFAPTEIFFANYGDFDVVFSEFGGRFWQRGLVATLVIAVVLFLLPKLLTKIVLCVMWIFSLCGYIQTMFLNQHMDSIGATTFGYQPENSVVIKDFVIWGVVIVIALVLIFVSKKNWTKLVLFTSLILIGMQGVAYASLFLSANDEAFSLEIADGELTLDGSERFTVSSKGNVIVFILDTVNNMSYDEWMLKYYPEAAGILKDFTYYNNADSCDYGTFPTVSHILTGNTFKFSQGIREYFEECWTRDTTVQYYEDLHDAGYQVKVYMKDTEVMIADLPLSTVEGMIDNVREDTAIRAVDKELLDRTLLEMSAYRLLPDYFKPKFDVPNEQYLSIVSYPDNVIEWANPDFYASMTEKGKLDTTNDTKYVIYYHLNGVHECVNDEYCNRIPAVDATEETISTTLRGAWEMLDVYLQYMKDAGVYDNSTIIVTADHGTQANIQPIFFIKEAHETKKEMSVTSAPITWDEFLPTVAEAAGLNGHKYGETIYDYKDGELRERTYVIRADDPDYPYVDSYTGIKNMLHLVYRTYTYTGDRNTWRGLYGTDQYETTPGLEAFYH